MKTMIDNRMKIHVEGKSTITLRDTPSEMSLKGDKEYEVIILHGFKSSSKSVIKMAKKINSWGYPVIARDHLGHGARKNDGKVTDFLGMVSEINSFINTRKNVILIGDSLGGMFSLILGWLNPHIKQVFAISSVSGIIDDNHVKRLEFLFNVKFTRMKNEYSGFLPRNLLKCKLENEDKFFLIHCKTDSIMPFEEFEENKRMLCIPDENTLVINKISGIGWLDHILIKNDKRTMNFIKNKIKR